jgi:hypothetical protein
MEFNRKQTQSYQDKIIKELESIPDASPFTAFEDDMMKKYYSTKGGGTLAKVLKKPRWKIYHRAILLGLKRSFTLKNERL